MSEMRSCCEQSKDSASCVFGCGHRVNEDTMRCPSCRDNSCNAFECEECGTLWEKWTDVWEKAAEQREPHSPSWTDAWPKGTPLKDIFADNH